MLYPSNAFLNSDCSPDKMDARPMVGLVKINGKLINKSWTHENLVPSPGDIAWSRSDILGKAMHRLLPRWRLDQTSGYIDSRRRRLRFEAEPD
jgi:hypothetical protein